MASGQTLPLTGQSAIDTCVQTFAKLCFTSQRVQCGCLPLPSQRLGSDFHEERTKKQLHYFYTTRYCGSQGMYSVENTTWAENIYPRWYKRGQPPPAAWSTICRSCHCDDVASTINVAGRLPVTLLRKKGGRLVSSINIKRRRKSFAHVVRSGEKLVNQWLDSPVRQ